ncbi:MAG: 4Fe-4S dicluster domain-containing protein [Desulfovibrio sp.]|jgi:Ni,Fe-hydrogenase III small subunit/ferredoxin|nr:4Fe-4S dicluster domain-containing protein [Desulfovibrio sp.]
MLNIFLERLRQKKRTVPYPKALPQLPPRFRGRPLINARRCDGAQGTNCRDCADACPAGAIAFDDRSPVLDTGLCTFCGACATACKRQALFFTTDWRLASSSRDALLVRPGNTKELFAPKGAGFAAVSLPGPEPLGSLDLKAVTPPPIRPFAGGGAFRRSFRLRQVSAAGCGACEADLNVLSTVVFDLARFGIDFVASPRHADALVITGPAPRNMKQALLICDEATPKPRAVIAVGACAISGGLFHEKSGATDGQEADGASALLPVDLYIPGCPPHPYTNLDGLLRFLGLSVQRPSE